MLSSGKYIVSIEIVPIDGMGTVAQSEVEFTIDGWLAERSKIVAGEAIDKARDAVLAEVFTDGYREDGA